MRVKWSQNFLIDQNLARKCAESIEPQPEDAVLEIGPGKGVLTQLLLPRVKRVVAVEIDPLLAGRLPALPGAERLRVFRSDFLEPSITPAKLRLTRYKIIGNLPYAVVSPIVQKILTWKGWSRAAFMVQKEVGERLIARPDTPEYGILSISVQCRAKVRTLFAVPRGCFRPVPNVESVVIGLEPLPEPLIQPKDEERFFRAVRAGFAHRRKTLLNSLKFEIDRPAEELAAAIRAARLDPGTRAETLGIDDFRRLAENL